MYKRFKRRVKGAPLNLKPTTGLVIKKEEKKK